MDNWTQDATEYLDGYLQKVPALARRQGDDADEIVSDLRDHITQEVENTAGDTVDIDTLIQVLATTGTPEEVANLDTSLRGPSPPHVHSEEHRATAYHYKAPNF
jgi:hypothetical protein